MATYTSDIVHLSDSHDSNNQYEVWHLVQQVIHFIDSNNVPSSDNEFLNNDSSDIETVDSENGENGNCVQIPISNYEWDTEHETDFEMEWEWIFHFYPGLSVRPFLGEEMLLMDWDKNEPHHFFEALFEDEIWNYIAHKTNKYAETRITQRHK